MLKHPERAHSLLWLANLNGLVDTMRRRVWPYVCVGYQTVVEGTTWAFVNDADTEDAPASWACLRQNTDGTFTHVITIPAILLFSLTHEELSAFLGSVMRHTADTVTLVPHPDEGCRVCE